jgi:hypothetical protein
VKAVDDASKQSGRGSREDDDVDVQQQGGGGAALGVDEEGGIGGRGDEAELSEKRGEALVLHPRGLLEVIEGALEEADGVGSCWVDEAGGC